MKKNFKIELKESFISSIIGLCIYLVVFLVLPIETNTIIDIVIFGFSFLIGSVIYSCIKQRSRKDSK